MNILVISASNRAGSQSLKISNQMVEKLNALSQSTELLDLRETRLPLFDSDKYTPEWRQLSPKVSNAEGFVWVVPEWDGMVPPALINFLGHARHELAHKPVLLVGISAGMNGAYPIAELKMVGGKNRHHVLVPEQIVIKNVGSMMNSPEPEVDNSQDTSLHNRANYSLSVLVNYAVHLKQIRESGIIDLESYPMGM